MILDPLHNPLSFVPSGGGSHLAMAMDEDQFFNSFVDPMMLLPGTAGEALAGSGYGAQEGAGLGAEAPGDSHLGPYADAQARQSSQRSSTAVAAAAAKPGSLYNRLRTAADPMSPLLMGSPYLGGAFLGDAAQSPPALLMGQDPSWMHSTRPRRRRSHYASPTLGAWGLGTQPAPPVALPMGSPQQYALGLGPMGMAMGPCAMPMGGSDPWAAALAFSSQHGAAPLFYAGPWVAPRTPKFPMAPAPHVGAAHGASNSPPSSGAAAKMPLVLPFQLGVRAPPGIDSGHATPAICSGAPSRCSSIAPSSSVSQHSAASSHRSGWFAEMSATKDLFLQEAAKVDLANVTVLELKTLLRKFGLNSTGKKSELAERVTEIAAYLQAASHRAAESARKRPRADAPVPV